MKKNLIIILITAMSLLSCHKVLDQYPADYMSPEQYYNTETQLNYALNGVYATLGSGALYGNNMLGAMGLDADEGFDMYSGDDATVGDYNVVTADVKILSYWKALYTGIDRANRLLQNINKPTMGETERNTIKGEALFLRAYYYFMLVSRFGDVPLVLHTIESPTVENLQIPRTPAKEVYNKILTDMEEASLLVKDINTLPGGGRISKSAVWGIMARVCLYMAGNPINETSKYAEAKKWAGKVIELNFHQLNPSYSQIFINYAKDLYDTKESIWEVEFWGNGTGLYTTGMVGRNNGIGSTNDPLIGYATGQIRTSRWYYLLFTTGDLRRDWSVAPFYYSGNPGKEVTWSGTQIYQRFCGKFRRVYEVVTPREGGRTPQNFPLLRYADVLLMYAEADLMANSDPTEEIHEYLNRVRRRARGLDPLAPSATVDLKNLDAAALLNEIKDERSRELGYEMLRKGDLIRWGEFFDNMKAIVADVAGKANDYEIGAYKYFNNAKARDVLWPIPYYEMSVNKKLVQNPGW